MMLKIGVLALQGAVREHVQSLEANDVDVVVIKRPEQLQEVDGLVFPGGESTTMRRLINKYGFFEELQQFVNKEKPIFGTCAGAILMARELIGDEDPFLKAMDIAVERNAFGRQRESFEATLKVESVGDDIEAVFIRAPIISNVGQSVDVLATFNGQVVAAQQGPFLACSFHPELTEDRRFHQYFVDIVRKQQPVVG
ncbi:5'-phosphate synthase pdxT subunit [Texcoconibacillus texcoconensis]|uniref:Pyridoxal 5'-phosphate synthase subunit PdxT n=2 Tax=Texcoconibacillus texcoconensis TaxID=1095777 RepID=A0A840QUH2_9BACI|nr:5'-phosphate synthase pdxT subunit [Texcoconibacillus texcoconensis]